MKRDLVTTLFLSSHRLRDIKKLASVEEKVYAAVYHICKRKRKLLFTATPPPVELSKSVPLSKHFYKNLFVKIAEMRYSNSNAKINKKCYTNIISVLKEKNVEHFEG